ncbi:MAG: di-trans,poly-cis-decaprenylcistransferase [Chloroflexi bacterium]|nr:di-trans,poly-cis-decaprenylcistransferase [Chloroflexota bacterium]
MGESAPLDLSALVKVPVHVGIIMDGNGRWATARGLQRTAGHQAGVENLRTVMRAAAEFGVKILSVYAFSTENWGRPESEVRALMALFGQAMEREYAALMENNVRVRHLGSKERLGRSLATRLDQIIADTANNTGLTVNVAINYGGRAEISEAVRAIIAAGTPPEMVSEVLISEHLGTAGQPDPDLIIRTAGEMRLSNFLLWQAAYAEYYSTPLTWPEFGREAFYEALLAFGQRKRRFGKLNQ